MLPIPQCLTLAIVIATIIISQVESKKKDLNQ